MLFRSNSVEAIGKTGKIKITVRIDQQEVCIAIQDSGSGIPENILRQLGAKPVTFGKHNSDAGFGLGLSHAFTVVKNQGGAISINSEVGQGTVVEISLPLKELPSWHVSQVDLRNKDTVVVIDDDPSIHCIWEGKPK